MNAQPPVVPPHPRGWLKFVAPVFLVLVVLAFMKFQSSKEQAAMEAAALQAQAQHMAREQEMTQAMARDYQGRSRDAASSALVARVGQVMLQKTDAKNHTTPIRFHLLAEPNAINLFTVGRGDVYVTTALVNRMQTEGQLAGILAQGVAHVMAGHVARAVERGQYPLPLWAYSVAEETEADKRAVALMSQAGYDPNAMLGMFAVLSAAHQAGADVAYFTSHPSENDRLMRLGGHITALYPQGAPAELSK